MLWRKTSIEREIQMDYSSIEQRGTDIVLTEIKNFIPSQVLDNGQCFRWSGSADSYTGVAHGRHLELFLEKDALVLKNVTLNEFESVWRDYFDLGRDYGQLRQLYATDDTLSKAMAFSPGLRIMKQDPWETLITFILSQNSNIPRIKSMVALLCENFGQALPLNKETVTKSFTFPTPESLALLSADDLTSIRSGYRAAYIIDAAKRVADGRFDLKALHNMESEDIRLALMKIHGVGPKVADCVLLYGFGRVGHYPLDVWMKRVMASYYPDGFPDVLTNTAGIAQQYLFHYIRNHKEP